MCKDTSKCRFKKNNFNVIVINFIKFHFDGTYLCMYTSIPSKESSDEQEGLYGYHIHKISIDSLR